MWTQRKLQRLRERYAQPDGDLRADVPFREALKQFADSGLDRKKPYGDPPTLLDFPYSKEWEGLDTALVGVPMDLGVTNRPGARFGPRALRAIERVGPYHPTYNLIPGNVVRCADVGDVPFRSRFSLKQSIEDIEAFYRKIAGAGMKPVSAGGDHSITYPIMKALGAEKPLGMVHIDAHCDTAGPYDDEKFHHGGPFRLAVLAGCWDPERCRADRHPRQRRTGLGIQLRFRHDRDPHGGLSRNGFAGRHCAVPREDSGRSRPT